MSSALALPATGAQPPAIPLARRWVARGVGHLDLLSDRSVFRRLRQWLE